jgi:hypothetical protein
MKENHYVVARLLHVLLKCGNSLCDTHLETKEGERTAAIKVNSYISQGVLSSVL